MEKTVKYLLERMREKAREKERCIIAIGGEGCSGKTKLSEELYARLPKKETRIIHADCYYKSHEVRRRLKVTGAHPKACNLALFKKHVNDIKKGKPIVMPRRTSPHLKKWSNQQIKPSRINIIEGLLTFLPQELPSYDLSIFIECPKKLQWQRRKRDAKKPNRKEENIKELFHQRNKEFEKFVLPNKEHADIILQTLPNGWKIV